MAESWEMSGRERRYSVPALANGISEKASSSYRENRYNTSEDLHAWSIYRQNLNSDFADSALGSQEKTPLPYGNFQLNSSTVQSILNHPKYGPKSELANNTNAYLKFGLPRVLPPSVARIGRDGSSGYDSSNDGSPVMKHKSHFSKSDPDFRRHIIQHQGPVEKLSRERRMKSSSEANLLAADAYRHRAEQSLSTSRPASQQSKHSKMGSHISSHSRQQWNRNNGPNALNYNVYPSRDFVMLNVKYFPKDKFFNNVEDNEEIFLKHPHLQIRGLTCEKSAKEGKFNRILDNISMEVRAGEVLGILATSDKEGTTLLEIIANRHQRRGCTIRGDVVVNGVTVPFTGLSDRIAYAQETAYWHPDLSVRQTLLFTALLQAPGNSNRNFDTKGRIDALIEDLGLEPVRHCRVPNLTVSERRRLNVACQLLLDTDIVMLNQPTKGMDVFDTFFLVEYLRQWAARGRIVMMTIHPPTYEIFTMLSRVALISSGRLMYCGRRREMLPYFAFIEFPCPAYKNPSDYYLDLVTLDDLTAEALLESSQRAQHLADTFRRRQEPLSDPGPPGALPSKIKRANFFSQILALWIRAVVFTFPNNIQRWFGLFLMSAFISVTVGAIFWNVRTAEAEQEHINDRLALYYVLGMVTIWPILLATISDVWKEKDIVARDFKDELYGKTAFIFSKITHSSIGTGGIFLAYLIPALALAGIDPSEDGLHLFGLQIGHMMLYLFAIRMVAISFGQMFPSRHQAAVSCGLLLSCLALTSGYIVHLQNLGFWTGFLRWISPLYWTLKPLGQLEFQNITHVECSRNPVTRQEAPGIVVKIPCGISSGKQAASYWALQYDLIGDHYAAVLIAIFYFVFLLIYCVTLFCCSSPCKMSRHKRVRL